MKTKFEANGLESQLFGDLWQMCKKWWTPRAGDDYWNGLMEEWKTTAGKYKDCPLCDTAKTLLKGFVESRNAEWATITGQWDDRQRIKLDLMIRRDELSGKEPKYSIKEEPMPDPPSKELAPWDYEYLAFNDLFYMAQEWWIPEDDDGWWDSLYAAALDYTRRYRHTPAADFARRMGMALYESREGEAKKMGHKSMIGGSKDLHPGTVTTDNSKQGKEK